MVYPHISKKFPHRPRLIRFLLQRWNSDGTDILDVGLPFPVSVESSLWSQARKFQDKMTSKQALQHVPPAHSMLGKLSFKAVKASTERVFSGLYVTGTV